MNRLAERAHECHAVYIKNEDTQLNRIRLRNGGAVRCLNAARYFDARALADFAAYISRIRPSAIVAANPYALMYSALALRFSRLRAPLIVTYHSTRLLRAKEQLQMMIYRLFFWTSDCSVFVCERQWRYWLRRGVFSRRNEVIYNGVDTEEFCDKWSPEERRTFPLSGSSSERRILNSVVFPAPFFPTRPTFSPGLCCQVTPRRTSFGPKRLKTSSNR